MSPNSKHLFVQLFKWIPPVSVLILTIHVGFLLLGYVIPFTEFIIDSSFLGGSLLLVSSILFDMCKLHKACIWYTCLVTLCIDILRWIGFGVLLTPMRCVVFMIGLILVILLLRKYAREIFIPNIKKDCR